MANANKFDVSFYCGNVITSAFDIAQEFSIGAYSHSKKNILPLFYSLVCKKKGAVG